MTLYLASDVIGMFEREDLPDNITVLEGVPAF
jgi:hypothetical protein